MSCAMHTGFFALPYFFQGHKRTGFLFHLVAHSVVSPLSLVLPAFLFSSRVGSVVGIFAAHYSMTDSLTSQWEIQVFPVAGNTIMLNSEGQALPQVEGHSPCLCILISLIQLPHSTS